MTSIGAADLGQDLARLVWESFTDFIDEANEVFAKEGGAARHMKPEQALILFMWVHTQVTQQSFGARGTADAVRGALDEMHRAVFEDLEAHGISRTQLPLFEQRVSAGYSRYYAAAAKGPEAVAELGGREVFGRKEGARPVLRALVAEATAGAAGPLHDFLADIELS